MATSDLPAWASWMQALGVPVFGAIISAIGLRIAWLQQRLQDMRFRHELYDRRYKVYAAAKGLLASVQAHGCVNGPDFLAFVGGLWLIRRLGAAQRISRALELNDSKDRRPARGGALLLASAAEPLGPTVDEAGSDTDEVPA
jgi:hypothetical protein